MELFLANMGDNYTLTVTDPNEDVWVIARSGDAFLVTFPVENEPPYGLEPVPLFPATAVLSIEVCEIIDVRALFIYIELDGEMLKFLVEYLPQTEAETYLVLAFQIVNMLILTEEAEDEQEALAIIHGEISAYFTVAEFKTVQDFADFMAFVVDDPMAAFQNFLGFNNDFWGNIEFGVWIAVFAGYIATDDYAGALNWIGSRPNVTLSEIGVGPVNLQLIHDLLVAHNNDVDKVFAVLMYDLFDIDINELDGEMDADVLALAMAVARGDYGAILEFYGAEYTYTIDGKTLSGTVTYPNTFEKDGKEVTETVEIKFVINNVGTTAAVEVPEEDAVVYMGSLIAALIWLGESETVEAEISPNAIRFLGELFWLQTDAQYAESFDGGAIGQDPWYQIKLTNVIAPDVLLFADSLASLGFYESIYDGLDFEIERVFTHENYNGDVLLRYLGGDLIIVINYNGDF
jgi:hypothetical protein